MMGAPDGAALAALVEQLDRTQWATPEAVAEGQLRHLERLARHGAAQSPDFARRLQAAGLAPSDLGDRRGLTALPVQTRRDVQRAGDSLFCRTTPPGHGRVFESRTSGSTGEPVVVRRTGVNALFWMAMAMRDMRWHGRDLSGRLCSVGARLPERHVAESWGWPASFFARTGPMLVLPVTSDVAVLVDAIVDFAPTTLVVYPSTLAALVEDCRRRRVSLPGLEHLLTIGETLSPAVRADAEDAFDVSLADLYSSEEVGHIAVQCPVSGLYHVAAEAVLAEVLDERGQPCTPGEVGRIVVTDLHNYATPLVRYDIGDYAEVGPACGCGRGLPTWSRVLGRERNLIRMPDGRRHWPLLGLRDSRDVAPVTQFQVVQENAETVTARLVVERPLSRAEEEQLRDRVRASLGHPFDVRFAYVDGRIPSGPTGKYEEFVCRVA
jgi:phenylacetate-CoA ligase